ncbi:hypothetical protein [Haliangium ochraceum]|uniref:Uncharacterized protein n=1 Tax=Haliangium ochraceum (strain DSM 14365 / JCM 11303 / SMP-2) TaxID=502025 RepID=D0LKK5_HALO1|nr:hypothetical protein [Haliangium ochraceum]ACY15053.1 hypothetical protein Hoch_2517 [Haliangium ochraceum DSM 14365]
MTNTRAHHSLRPQGLAHLVTKLLTAGLVLGLGLITGLDSARAQSESGVYEVSFEGVTSNCAQAEQFALSKGRATLQRAGEKGVTLELSGLPVSLPTLKGSQRRGGKLKAEAEGRDAKGQPLQLTASGRVEGGSLEFLLIVEHRGSGQCSQSWNVTGRRAAQ